VGAEDPVPAGGAAARKIQKFHCAHCGSLLQAKAVAKRTKIKCPQCAREFYLLPSGEVEGAAPRAGTAGAGLPPPPPPPAAPPPRPPVELTASGEAVRKQGFFDELTPSGRKLDADAGGAPKVEKAPLLAPGELPAVEREPRAAAPERPREPASGTVRSPSGRTPRERWSLDDLDFQGPGGRGRPADSGEPPPRSDEFDPVRTTPILRDRVQKEVERHQGTEAAGTPGAARRAGPGRAPPAAGRPEPAPARPEPARARRRE